MSLNFICLMKSNELRAICDCHTSSRFRRANEWEKKNELLRQKTTEDRAIPRAFPSPRKQTKFTFDNVHLLLVYKIHYKANFTHYVRFIAKV